MRDWRNHAGVEFRAPRDARRLLHIGTLRPNTKKLRDAGRAVMNTQGIGRVSDDRANRREPRARSRNFSVRSVASICKYLRRRPLYQKAAEFLLFKLPALKILKLSDARR